MTTLDDFRCKYRILPVLFGGTKRSTWYFVLILIVIMASVRGFGGPGVKFPEYTHATAVSELAASQNNFTRDMYVKLAKEGSGNLFFSPFSIMTALGMTLAGARGNTKEEMLKVMHLKDTEDVHDAFEDVVADIKTEVPEYELNTANAAYVSNLLKVLDEYQNILTKKYMSSAETVDFNQEAVVRNKINSHVEEVTKSRIKDLIPSGVLTPLTRMVLVNAVYFKGIWENQFKESNTSNENFWISEENSVQVPMMHLKDKFGYGKNEELGATLLRMDYKGSRLSMVIVLPDERTGLAAVEAKLASSNFMELDKGLWRKVEVEVTVPKFKLEESLDLEKHLGAMGMPDLFSDRDADLSGISGTKDLFVSKVLHKSFIEVNEQGSEAAAATGFVISARSLVLDNFSFKADHPFLFYIKDKASNLVLFAGRFVTTPSTAAIQREEL